MARIRRKRIALVCFLTMVLSRTADAGVINDMADPEVIIAQEKEFLNHVYGDPKWQSVRAVKNKRGHLIPRAPFNWFGRPPSFMRLLDIKWLTNILHPDRYRLNLPTESKEFYRLFLGVELNDESLQKVLQQECGMLGWVGLVIPHMSRMLVGPDNRIFLPATTFIGAIFLLIIDDLSRLLFQVEIPLGILTALVGVPVFALILKNARKGWGGWS